MTMRRERGRLTQLVRRLAQERNVHEWVEEGKTVPAWGIGHNLYGDGDYADAYADHLPTPFGEQHLHLNWRWGNYYWRITKQKNKLCGTNRCRRVRIELPEVTRVDQDAPCPKCKLEARLHPFEPFILGNVDSGDPRPYLTRLCDGSLVKL